MDLGAADTSPPSASRAAASTASPSQNTPAAGASPLVEIAHELPTSSAHATPTPPRSRNTGVDSGEGPPRRGSIRIPAGGAPAGSRLGAMVGDSEFYERLAAEEAARAAEAERARRARLERGNNGAS